MLALDVFLLHLLEDRGIIQTEQGVAGFSDGDWIGHVTKIYTHLIDFAV